MSGKRSAKAKEEFVEALKGMDVIAEMIVWKSSPPSPFTKVKKALEDAGLDGGMVSELPMSYAFKRAVNKMTEQKVIDPVPKQDGDASTEVCFQFTAQWLEDKKWKFGNEKMVRLDLSTGVVKCSDKELETQAKAELDKAIETKTTSDINTIVHRIFRTNSHIIHWGEGSRTYLVPTPFIPFTDKVDAFLKNLGSGGIDRLPIPSGSKQSNSVICETVSSEMERMLKEHEEAVEGFTIGEEGTRLHTLENQAKKINETRHKLEAYAWYLGDKQKELMESVENLNGKLKEKIEKAAAERAAARPPKQEVDKLGSRLETDCAKVNAFLSETEPKKCRQLMKEAGVKTSVEYHLDKLVRLGLATWTEESGYLLTGKTIDDIEEE